MKFEAIALLCVTMVVGSCFIAGGSKSNTELKEDTDKRSFRDKSRGAAYEDRFPDVQIDFDIPDVVAIDTSKKGN